MWRTASRCFLGVLPLSQFHPINIPYVWPCHVVNEEIAETMVVPIENPADCEVRGVIRFLQADEILGYLAEKASSRVELFCCTTMHVRILPGLAAWVAQSEFFLFTKMKEHLAGKLFESDEDLKNAGLITRRPHGMKRVYKTWCQGTTNTLMSKATMWKSRQRYMPKLVYSVSVLLLNNILVWRNVLYFM